MHNIDQAVSMFGDGFSCSQAILTVYGAALGLDRETALKLAAGFGGGMAGKGQACGAVTGAVMVLGLAMGHVTVEDKNSQMRAYAAVHNLLSRFEEAHGSVNCQELLGHDLDDPEDYRRAKENGVFKDLCPGFVASAARLLEDLLNDQNEQ